MLALPTLIPFLNAVVGPGYRLDHLPLTIIQRPGAEGFDFHGGAIASSGAWNEVCPIDGIDP